MISSQWSQRSVSKLYSFIHTISLPRTDACYTMLDLVSYLHLAKFSWREMSWWPPHLVLSLPSDINLRETKGLSQYLVFILNAAWKFDHHSITYGLDGVSQRARVLIEKTLRVVELLYYRPAQSKQASKLGDFALRVMVDQQSTSASSTPLTKPNLDDTSDSLLNQDALGVKDGMRVESASSDDGTNVELSTMKWMSASEVRRFHYLEFRPIPPQLPSLVPQMWVTHFHTNGAVYSSSFSISNSPIFWGAPRGP